MKNVFYPLPDPSCDGAWLFHWETAVVVAVADDNILLPEHIVHGSIPWNDGSKTFLLLVQSDAGEHRIIDRLASSVSYSTKHAIE
jgi:hypothetical protein